MRKGEETDEKAGWTFSYRQSGCVAHLRSGALTGQGAVQRCTAFLGGGEKFQGHLCRAGQGLDRSARSPMVRQ